jgi:integrase
MTIKTWTEATVLRVAPPAALTTTETTVWHPTIPRFGIRFRRDRAGGWGTGTYTVCYFQGGRDHTRSIGKVGGVTLAIAVAEAQKTISAVAQNLDPQAERDRADAAHAHVFKVSIADYVEHLTVKGCSARHIAATQRFLTVDFPDLRERPLRLITRAQCADALRRLLKPGPGWTGGKSVAIQGRAALRAYFEWLLGEGRVDSNPVHGTNKIERDPPIDRALTEAELRAVLIAMDSLLPGTRRVFRLIALTGTRRDQIGQLRKEWLDLDAAIPVIRLPGKERGAVASRRRGGSKNGEVFLIPLSRQAVAILREQLREAAPDSAFVFGGGRHGQTGTGFAGYAKPLEALHARCGDAVAYWTLHDLRRTFVTLGLEKLRLDPVLLDACLNHRAKLVTQSAVGGIYQRATLLEARVPVVQAWADYCDSLTTAPKLRLVAA